MTDTDVFGVAMATQFTATSKAKGSVDALVSAFDVAYSISGEIHEIKAGAFADQEGEATPIYQEHSWANWDASRDDKTPIGHGTPSETAAGLRMASMLYVQEDPTIARLHRSMKANAIREWSIGYKPLEWTAEEDDNGIEHKSMTKAELFEASVVMRGANPATETYSVASAVVKAAADGELDVDLMEFLDIDAIAESVIAAMDTDELAMRLAGRIDGSVKLAAHMAGLSETIEPQKPAAKKAPAKKAPAPVPKKAAATFYR